MFIKLGIIVGIVILGGMIFSNEIDSLFPNTSATIVDSLKNDISNFNTKSLDSVETRIDESIDKIVDKTSDAISDAITDEISNIGNDISNKISNVRQSAQQTITEKIINFNPLDSIQNIFTNII